MSSNALFPASEPLVPELTRNAGIQLNERVLLQGHAKAIASSHRKLSPSGPSMAKPPGDHIPLGGFVFHTSRENSMSDLFVTKQVDGYPANFIRFAGPENFVIEVNGAERTVTREFWRDLPHRDAAKVEEPSKVTLTG
jgi:hypothetical protein